MRLSVRPCRHCVRRRDGQRLAAELALEALLAGRPLRDFAVGLRPTASPSRRCFGGRSPRVASACVPRADRAASRPRAIVAVARTLLEASRTPDQDRLGFLDRGGRFGSVCRLSGCGVRHRLGGVGDYRSDVGRRLRRRFGCSGASARRRRRDFARQHSRSAAPALRSSSAAGLGRSAGGKGCVGSVPTTAGVSTACGVRHSCRRCVGGFRRRILFGSEAAASALGYRRDVDDCRRFGLQRRRPVGFRLCRSGFRGCSCAPASISAIRAFTAAAGLASAR